VLIERWSPKLRFTRGPPIAHNNGLNHASLTTIRKESLTVETITMSPAVQQIGETAGAVWHALNENGSLSLAKLVDQVGGNRDVIMQAVGWLAREGKVDITETKRGRVVSLCEE
jgi:Winged helix-turn-helix domain (DUF2582)